MNRQRRNVYAGLMIRLILPQHFPDLSRRKIHIHIKVCRDISGTVCKMAWLYRRIIAFAGAGGYTIYRTQLFSSGWEVEKGADRQRIGGASWIEWKKKRGKDSYERR